MSAPQSKAKVLALAGLVIAMTVATWYLLRPADVSPLGAATPAAVPTPHSAPTAPPDPGAAGESSTQAPGPAAAPEAPLPADPVAVAAADQHQSGKIARGLSEHGGSGLLVSASPAGSVTEQLRLQPGDIVVTVNGEPVATTDDFVRIYRTQGPPTQLTILRQGREIHLH